jgi:hypothetical protein
MNPCLCTPRVREIADFAAFGGFKFVWAERNFDNPPTFLTRNSEIYF